MVLNVLEALEKNGRYEAFVQPGPKVGLVTVRDILKTDRTNQKLARLWRSFTPYDTVRDAAHELIERNIRALPVVGGQEPAGIFSQVDVVHEFADCPECRSVKAKDLPAYLR